ncbi:MAG: DUF4236 domain-containing protein [Phycisphaerales bacterium]|nr:DUF4236 domain-containing protein [Phycisphaerales bacterium]
MGYLRLFRRVRIAPGLTLNLTKHGASLSAGVRGAHVTLGRTGLRRTVGIPGTGIFYTSHTGLHSGLHTAPHFAGDKAALSPATGSMGKRALPAMMLCLLLGLLGAHRFYAGRLASGLLMLLLTLSLYGTLISVPWMLIDLSLIVCGRFTDHAGQRIRW